MQCYTVVNGFSYQSVPMVHSYQMENSRHTLFNGTLSSIGMIKSDAVSLSFPDPMMVYLISICYPLTSHLVNIEFTVESYVEV